MRPSVRWRRDNLGYVICDEMGSEKRADRDLKQKSSSIPFWERGRRWISPLEKRGQGGFPVSRTFILLLRVGENRSMKGLLIMGLMLSSAGHAYVGVCLTGREADRMQMVSTFSIVAWDPENGDLGAAVQSRSFAVGAVVPWAEAEVGAIATQALANPSFGPKGLTLLKQGLSASEALERLIQEDSGRDERQVGIIDAKGRTAVYTGAKCIPWAGSVEGNYYAAQGNLLVREEVVQAMGSTFEETSGDLAEKLMAALEAGQKAGGDSRGQQAAALLVMRKGGGRGGFNDRYIDLRVDDHKEPIRELRRLLRIHRRLFGAR